MSLTAKTRFSFDAITPPAPAGWLQTAVVGGLIDQIPGNLSGKVLKKDL